MGRPVTSGLQALLDLRSCNTQTTLSLYPITGSPVHIATDEFTADGKNFAPDLRGTEDIQQSINATPSRVNVEAQNVDKAFGILLASGNLAKATAVVGRLFRREDNFAVSEWRELFRGEVIPQEIVDGTAKIEVLHDLVAAGYCVANWSLGENCQLVYGHLGTCGFTVSPTYPTCNKKRKSPLGCAGKIVTGTTTNEYRFGGMEFPEVQTPDVPIGGGDGDDPGGDHPYCPTPDQWVPVRGRGWKPVPKRVRELKPSDELYHPIWRTFHAIESATVIPDQPIWGIIADNSARGFSSGSHPVFPHRGHPTGVPVSLMLPDDPLLMWRPDRLDDSKVNDAFDTGQRGDVVRIEMVDGHVYCYSDTPEGPFIVCHNAKNWNFDVY